MNNTQNKSSEDGSPALAGDTNSLSVAYKIHLGEALAISPELYDKALEAIARSLGRANDDAFRDEVRAYEKTMPHYLD